MKMLSEESRDFLFTALEIMAASFIVVIGLLALWAIHAFVADISQTKQAIRRNYPLIARIRTDCRMKTSFSPGKHLHGLIV